MDLKISPVRLLTGYTVGPAPEGSTEWNLAQTGIKTLFVDLHNAARESVVDEWLSRPHPMRSIGSGFSAAAEQNFLGTTTLKKSFDGIFFVNATTRARPNPGIKNVAPVQ